MDSLWISFGFHRDWFPLDCLWIPKVFPNDFLWLLCGQQLQNPASFRSRRCSNAFFFEKNGLDSLLLFKRFQNPASCEAGRCRNASFFVVNILWNSWPLPNNFRTQLLFEAGRCSNAAFFNEVLFGFPSSVHTILEPSFLRSRGVRERSFFDETFVGISCRCPAVLESIFFSQQKVAATQLFSRVDGLDSLLLFKLFQNPASFKAGRSRNTFFLTKHSLEFLASAQPFQNPASFRSRELQQRSFFQKRMVWIPFFLPNNFRTQLRLKQEGAGTHCFL